MAGSISRKWHKWAQLTSDSNILNTVKGFKFEFHTRPYQDNVPPQIINSPEEIRIAEQLLGELLAKQVVQLIQKPDPRGFLSNIFLRPKKTGDYRMILNLKQLNEFVRYHHFKMDHLSSTLTLVSPGCYFTSIDLSDAYFSVSVAETHRKYMQFAFNGQYYQFTCLANGVSSAPRSFTKIMKVPLSTLRERHGILITAYLDDLLIVADSPKAVLQATNFTQTMLRALGFTISESKSVIKPTQSITFLGFDLNSVTMQVTVPPTKALDIKNTVLNTMQLDNISVRQFAGLLGKLAATLPGNRYGQLFLKHLEVAKTKALRPNPQNYDVIMPISQTVQTELTWWSDNIEHVHKPIYLGNPQLTIFTDASFLGWGCHIPSCNEEYGGRWEVSDLQFDINYLELKAILLSLQACPIELHGQHVQIQSDNMTAVTGINKQGSTHSTRCNSITRQIWLWAIDKQLWLSAAHCPGVLNVKADAASRLFNDNTEWMLKRSLFRRICTHFGTPSIDLFASRLNNQVAQYCSWQPDPGAIIIDCFSVDWSSHQLIYAFPPFSLIGRTLQKIAQECLHAIVVVPHWPSQSWFPQLQKLLVRQPLRLSVQHDTLRLPHDPNLIHPLAGRLNLWVCYLSKNTSNSVASPRKPLPL